jgi:hypothetical protein
MKELKEQTGIRGTVIVRAHPAGTIDAYHALVAEGKIEDAQKLISAGDVKVVQRNLVVDSLNYGIDILVQYLLSAYNGSFAFPLGIAYGEIGTGTTTPQSTDTALQTPTNRVSTTYAADSGYNTAITQFFFPDSVLANEDYYEFGTFIGGSVTIGSGNMFNHALFSSPYSKSAGTDTTVEVDFNFT